MLYNIYIYIKKHNIKLKTYDLVPAYVVVLLQVVLPFKEDTYIMTNIII